MKEPEGEGQRLWREARRIIPGGNQLLSKRCERFLPGQWPAYYQRARGCEVWDLDGRHFYDFAQMGVGSCVLGYADPDVDAAVVEAISRGGMCTLNAPEEVELARILISLHPWSEMARFARTGGEACAIAVRIARAATGKERVAFCGYHGWTDWYLSANLAESRALNGHLLPGLEPAGVPRGLSGTALPFNYGRLDELEELFDRHDDLGVVIMEPVRSAEPPAGYLAGVRRLVSRRGALLIFDEVTSGFRLGIGGAHLVHGVEPDLAVFAKALGNGYPIAAVIGRRDAMEAAQSTFISSTMWTERIGYVAALATLDKMGRTGAPKALSAHGLRIGAGWRAAAAKRGLSVEVDGIPPLAHLHFRHPDALALQTLFAQEMLERGFLSGAAVYATCAYTAEIIDNYLAACDEVFGLMREAMDAGAVRGRLKGGVIQPGFKRLT